MFEFNESSRGVRDIEARIILMGTLVGKLVRGVTEALTLSDPDLAARVVLDARCAPGFFEGIEKSGIVLLSGARVDEAGLRSVLVSIKYAAHLESIAEYSAQAARLAILLCEDSSGVFTPIVSRLCGPVANLLENACAAYRDKDPILALEVRDKAEHVKGIYDAQFSDTLACMVKEPHTVPVLSRSLFIMETQQRIGEHAAHMAECIRLLGSPANTVHADFMLRASCHGQGIGSLSAQTSW